MKLPPVSTVEGFKLRVGRMTDAQLRELYTTLFYEVAELERDEADREALEDPARAKLYERLGLIEQTYFRRNGVPIDAGVV